MNLAIQSYLVRGTRLKLTGRKMDILEEFLVPMDSSRSVKENGEVPIHPWALKTPQTTLLNLNGPSSTLTSLSPAPLNSVLNFVDCTSPSSHVEPLSARSV
jgi:hypothetical protein